MKLSSGKISDTTKFPTAEIPEASFPTAKLFKAKFPRSITTNQQSRGTNWEARIFGGENQTPLRGWLRKKSTVFKELTPRSRTHGASRPREKKSKVPNQDKHTPHTVLQKLSPKTLRTPLKPPTIKGICGCVQSIKTCVHRKLLGVVLCPEAPFHR